MRVVDNLTSVPPPAPIQVGNNGSSGGYKFDPDQVQSVINDWQSLLDELRQDSNQAQRLAYTQSPASDPASNQFMNGGMTPSTQTLVEQQNRMIQYAQNYIEALQKASGQIQTSEADANQAVNNAGQGAM